MKDEILLDSNILVYAYDVDAGKKHEIAKTFLEKCYKGEKVFALSIQNLNEFYTIVTTKIENPLKKEIALERINSFLNFHGFRILTPSQKTISLAIHLNKSSGIHYWDCFLAATMLENRIFHIYTENTKDFTFTGITAKNPFI